MIAKATVRSNECLGRDVLLQALLAAIRRVFRRDVLESYPVSCPSLFPHCPLTSSHQFLDSQMISVRLSCYLTYCPH